MGLVSAIVGTLLAGGAIGASQSQAKKERKKIKQQTRQADISTQKQKQEAAKTAQEILMAEDKAAATAKLQATKRKKSRIRTLLTGAGGTEEGPLAKKSLLGH